MVGLLQAPPGTGLYERMQKEGRLVNELSGDNVDGSTNIIPRMGLEALRDGVNQLPVMVDGQIQGLLGRDDVISMLHTLTELGHK